MKSIILSGVLFLAIGSAYGRTSNDHAENHPSGSASVKKSSAVVRNILSDKLPSRLLKTVKTQYKNYWITELYKETTNGKSSYHITLENADQKLKLSANPPANWVVRRVQPKNTESL